MERIELTSRMDRIAHHIDACRGHIATIDQDPVSRGLREQQRQIIANLLLSIGNEFINLSHESRVKEVPQIKPPRTC